MGSVATLRQVIERKLIQLGHEPRNTQVIISNVDSRLYLVNDSGTSSRDRAREHENNDV